MRYSWVIILYVFFLPYSGISQDYLGSGLYYGKVIKHKENLRFDIPSHSILYQVAHKRKVSGKQYWHQFYNRPIINHVYQFVNFGDDDVLGEGYALMKGLDFALSKKKGFTWYFSVYSGIGYVTEHFDRIENPTNNAIGSHLNNATRLGSSLAYSLSSNLDAYLNAHLLHFSNGLSQSPNSGINTWGVGLEVFYKIRDVDRVEKTIEKPEVKRPWIIDFNWQYSRSEKRVPGGPKYPNHVLAIGGGWQYHPLLSAFLGVEYEYSSGQYERFLRDFLSHEEAQKKAIRTSIYLAHEFTFSKIVFRPELAFYLHFPSTPSRAFYTKFGAHYFFREIFNFQPYAGVVLKTHYAVAEFVALRLGVRYRL